ncbi:MAG: 50S ribosomal protein L3 [bacterium]
MQKNMKFILGTKEYMTQVFDDNGQVYPVTVISAGPIVVTQVKTAAVDGYDAVQVGYGTRSSKRISKPVKGHLKDLGNFAHLKEFRVEGENTFKVGDKLDTSLFKEGEKLTVSAVSKGKGFQGVIKRYGFKGGPRSHGQKHSEREPGSLGGGGRDGGRVAKGKRMGGRMGNDRITVKNLKLIQIDSENNAIFVEGAVPGRRGALVEIRG